MSKAVSGRRGGRKGPRLEGAVKSARLTDRGLELIVRLSNPGSRALHYISEVRALRYDPATRWLNVRLSDNGLMVLPGIIANIPQIRVVDPQSEAEFSVSLPEKIVKLSETPVPPGELALEEHRIADAAEIAVDVAWADTPLYQDTRPHDGDDRPSIARWQQDELRLSYTMDQRPRSPR
jgi:hypothetical protein